MEYEIQTEALKILSINNISVASLKFVFRRRMEYHVTNTFLQVCTQLVIKRVHLRSMGSILNFAQLARWTKFKLEQNMDQSKVTPLPVTHLLT